MFSSEKDLVSSIKANYNRILNWEESSGSVEILEEVNLGFGIADLVISRLDSVKLRRSAIDSLTDFDIHVYEMMDNDQGISIKQIKKSTRVDSTTLNKTLERLIARSYIRESDDLYFVSQAYSTCILETVAVEAKLSNWKRALHQAYRYKWFASSSYVVLDSKNLGGALSNIDSFKRMNVGLAAIDNHAHVSMIHKPFIAKPLSAKMQIMLSERIFGKLS